ncbi:unnamed protein product [Acidithrix sp. C25]|nr:unnamed protein product [Acidithrix sp. C25]
MRLIIESYPTSRVVISAVDEIYQEEHLAISYSPRYDSFLNLSIDIA